ncbi:hypothetical protein [Devosia sp. LC5]|uniref:hypothetical protein n=1 Tax=Devosia sp. LC5 TaxID=1502724 RepID=UPI001362AB3F|nr:hypothetical protein [Devosia sp. LC5]
MISPTSRQRLGAVAAACLLSVALPAGTALAQKVKTPAPAPAPVTEFTVEIPIVDAVDSNLDEAILRDIFSGNVTEHAGELAGLSATSITIPEILVNVTTTIGEETNDAVVTFTDLVLSDVVDGVAGSVKLAGSGFDSGDKGSADMGPFSASNFNISGVLGMYGLVDAAGQTELETIYTDLKFEGGTVAASDMSCTFGAMTAAEFKARPLNYSFADFIALSEAMEDEDETPSPETIGKLMHLYADVFTAFESSPTEFAGFECSGIDEQDRSINFSLDGMTMAGMRPGIYPAITLTGLDITVEGDGKVGVGTIAIKESDLSGPIAVVQAAPETIDQAWLEANARSLIPAFAGFSFTAVDVDVPDPENADGRIAASIGAFDLTLGVYRNGIPTDLLTSASNIVVDLPADSDDEQIRQLAELGLTSIDAGFTVDASWNEAENTIDIDEVSFTGADLATVLLTGTLTNATEALFGLDENAAMMAAMDLAINHLRADVTDAGLSDLILATVAAEQGTDPAAMRPIFAGLAEGTVIGFLAGAAEAQKVGAAINSFVSGNAKQLTIDMTAKADPGLGLFDFMAAESDPASLIGKVNIEAVAK